MSKPISKQALYSMISSKAKDVIDRLFELTNSYNENVALGACKVLIGKTLPDVSSIKPTNVDVIDADIEDSIIRSAIMKYRRIKNQPMAYLGDNYPTYKESIEILKE
jgi:hypothetical protein